MRKGLSSLQGGSSPHTLMAAEDFEIPGFKVFHVLLYLEQDVDIAYILQDMCNSITVERACHASPIRAARRGECKIFLIKQKLLCKGQDGAREIKQI